MTQQLHPWRHSLIFSPPNLASNWINECQKFFPPEELQIKIWTPHEWNNDRNIRTVWIIKDSILSKTSRFSGHPFRSLISKNSLRLLSLFADEAHVFCRSNTSQRSKTYRDLLCLSEFSVYISGTPFPYGICSDARVVLEHIGGPFIDSTDGKWTPLQRNAFCNLLSDNRRWDTRIFRVLISEFCLRRTTESQWNNEWIIPRSVMRPTPLVRPPTAEDLWDSETKKEMTRLGKGFSKATLSDQIDRADKLRCLMWSPEVYYEIMQYTNGKLSDCQDQIEQAMTSTLFSYRPTSRLYELIGLIRGCFEREKRFIIVADRLYLITMAVAVLPLTRLLLMKRFATKCISRLASWQVVISLVGRPLAEMKLSVN